MFRAPLAVLLSALMFFMFACEDLDNIDVPITSQTEIAAATPLELLLGDFPLGEAFTRFDLSQSQAFKNEKYSVDDVDRVILSSLTMRVVTPDGQDLAFFGEVVFYLETQGLPRKEVARLSDFPVGATTVTFQTSPDDIKGYVLAREASVTTDVLDTKRPAQTTTIEVQAVFDVDINVL